jgi:predicted ribonuclease YlaK
VSFISNYKIIDTNVLLDFPHILDEPNLIIASDVLRELDGLKLSKNSEVAFKSRRAAILISKNLRGLTFDNSLEKIELTTDDKLLELTKSYAGELITNDVYLKLKATAAGVRNSGYGNSNDYTGVLHWNVDTENEIDKKDMLAMIEEHVLPARFSLKENEFLMAHNRDDIATFIY